jgi:hypothetical protein
MTYSLCARRYVNNSLGWEPMPEHVGGGVEHLGNFETRKGCQRAAGRYTFREDVKVSVWRDDEEVGYLDDRGVFQWFCDMDSAQLEAHLRMRAHAERALNQEALEDRKRGRF